MGTRLTPVSFDIETMGFTSDAEVTALGLSLPLGCRLFLQTGGRKVASEQLEKQMEETFETGCTVSTHQTEQDMLEGFSSFVTKSVAPNDYMVVAYNGERYRGGFDLPFLRTRCVFLDIRWPFDNLPYADLLPIFQRRFNTTLDDNEANDLEAVYEILVGGDLTNLDPFESSEEAVAAFESGDFSPLLAHNVSDILRTDALATVAQRYCATSEFNLKSLTPTLRDPNLDSVEQRGRPQ